MFAQSSGLRANHGQTEAIQELLHDSQREPGQSDFDKSCSGP
jgi:hypothetical protein